MLNGYSASTPQHLLLDAGKLYTGFESPASLGTLIGATRGGNTFTYTPELKDIGFDGAPGKVMGMKRIVGATVTLDVNLLEVTPDILKLATPGLGAADYPASPGTKTHDLLTASLTIASSEYKNIALVAEVNGKTDTAIVVIKNALANSPLGISCTEKEEGVIAITFEGHFDGSDLTEVPFEIYMPVDIDVDEDEDEDEE
jgi:hypothetical protein